MPLAWPLTGSARRHSSGKWEVRVYAGRDPITGKGRTVSRMTKGTTKREADQLARAITKDVEEGRHRSTTGTVGFLLERWYETASPEWSMRYAASVRDIIDGRLVPALGSRRIDRLEASDLEAQYARWLRQGLAPATVRKYHAVLHRALVVAQRWQWIHGSPALAAKAPERVTNRLSPPTPAQVQAVLAYLDLAHPELALFLALAAATGARRGELCALQAGDYDPTTAILSIRRAIAQDGAVIEVKGPKTDASDRRIAVDPFAAEVIRRLLVRQAERAAASGQVPSVSGYLFSDAFDSSVPWKPDRVTKAWGRLRGRLGMDGVRVHDLRHAVATSLLSGGVDVRTVAGRLGHADPAITLRTYSHWLPQADVAAAALMGALLSPRNDEAPVPKP